MVLDVNGPFGRKIVENYHIEYQSVTYRNDYFDAIIFPRSIFLVVLHHNLNTNKTKNHEHRQH
jgi:hypothetical protein